LIKNRPLSPDVLEIDNKSLHYKFPLGALSSIANRVTGVAMSVGESIP
jgi:succinate dehydrogenase (ubiquinone) cytochrome b560 subunit